MNKRRNIINLGVTAAVGMTWGKPILDSIVLPAHAQTSSFGPFARDFTVNVGGGSSYSFLFPSEDNASISIIGQGILRGDLVFEYSLRPAVGQGDFQDFVATSGSGDGYIDYLFVQNGVSSGPFRLTLINFMA